MHKTLITVCLVLGQVLSFCQAQEQKGLHFTARLNPLSVLDPLYPTLQVSGKMSVGRYALIYTHGFRANYIFESHKPDSAAYSIVKNKLELDYHFSMGTLAPFCGIQFFQGHYVERRYSGEFWQGHQPYGYDKALNDRKVYGLAFTYGIDYKLSRRLSLETTCAVGMRAMENDYKDVIYDSLVHVSHEWIGITPSNTAGRRITPHLSLALNFAWQIF